MTALSRNRAPTFPGTTAQLRASIAQLIRVITPTQADEMATADMAARLPDDIDLADEAAVDRELAALGIAEPVRTARRLEAVIEAARAIRARDRVVTAGGFAALLAVWTFAYVAFQGYPI